MYLKWIDFTVTILIFWWRDVYVKEHYFSSYPEVQKSLRLGWYYL